MSDQAVRPLVTSIHPLDATAKEVCMIFYPEIRRGRNQLDSEDLCRRFVVFTGSEWQYTEGLTHAVQQGWIIEHGGRYEITVAGCF